MAMTLHNFPEGMAVGVSFGRRDVGAATALAIGIGLQNIPEGLAIALPIRRGGMTTGRAFFWGQLSAAIEPVAGVIGARADIRDLPSVRDGGIRRRDAVCRG
jgi:ZIP family zinc transporter